ncbi:MAG: hypothetical protein AAF481_11175 [Acidobacteriota bacterium]
MKPAFFAAALFITLLAEPASAQTPIFGDDFESCDLSAWSAFVSQPDRVLRFTDLDLRDPHLFANAAPFGCLDITDGPAPFPTFNEQLADALSADGDDDGFLDLSPLLVFRPFDITGTHLRVNLDPGQCDAPPAPLSCLRTPGLCGARLFYDTSAAACLSPLPATTSGYTPALAEPTAPCFTSQAADIEIALLDLTVPLLATQIGADENATTGLLYGFLTEAAADALLLPAEFPVVGGDPLSSILPGGTGNCAPGDDRDTFNGQSGWWFYFNFTAAEPEAYTGF